MTPRRHHQRCHRHCRHCCHANKGQSMMSRHHHRYPPMSCCHHHCCTSRVQTMVPRRRCHPCVSEGQVANLRRLIIVAQAGGNQQRRGAIVRAAATVMIAQARGNQQCQGALVNAASTCMIRGQLTEPPPLSCVAS
jgi:hypothetical protein